FMHRITARLMFVWLLAGTFAPLALAASMSPPHACCVRKDHHCQEMASATADQPVIRDASCCNRNGCRALTVAHWADLRQALTSSIAPPTARFNPGYGSHDTVSFCFSRHSVRAPPLFSIA